MNERQRKAKLAKEKFVADTRKKREDIASGKNKNIPKARQKRQQALLENKEYDEIRDEIIPKGELKRRIERDPVRYEKYVSEENRPKKKATFWEGSDAHTENVPLYTPEQEKLMEFLGNEYQNRLPAFLEQISQKPSSPVTGQLENIFGHMSNPILQGLLNPGLGQNVQVLYPSQLQQQSRPGIDNLLGQLGQQYGPQIAQYGMENAPQALEYAQGLANQAGQYGQQFGGNIMNLLSGLASRFRGQQPQG